ncbi:anti-phage dCTP deaminase, partial [Haemophilus haemolyticus]|uniref:anti-phage dCTP deaminase n=1 Tax=Haemophilus haemolyticus TaxID=726 RepID=UPI00069BC515
MKKGTIISVNSEKKIARLKSEDGNEYPFFKFNLLKKELWEKLENGISVTFELDKSKGGKDFAKNIDIFLEDNEKYTLLFSNDEYLLPDSKINDSELIIGIVSSVGTPSDRIITPLKDRLIGFGYSVEEIRVSQFLPSIESQNINGEYERIAYFMEQGDLFRKSSNNNSILAIASSVKIKELRTKKKTNKNAYIINSLKHPDEVELLRKIYGDGFYLFGIHSDKNSRKKYLEEDKHCSPDKAEELIKVDENEDKKYGQKTRDTYHLSDFFLNLSDNERQVKNTLQRFLDLIFSDPYKTPTFDEYAMFMAFNSSVRSADLSRQVGAVISNNQQIISNGANDVPKFGGGLYWAEKDKYGKVSDQDLGRDYKRNVDQNKQSQRNIIENIIKKTKEKKLLTLEDEIEKLKLILKESEISDLTEFGRVVHAEMEAILACSREGISTRGTTLYCTTFPCHNCAKHIIASGIVRVVYVEPYPKSKALEFHDDSIKLQTNLDDDKSVN